MPRALDEFLHEQVPVPEGGQSLRGGAGKVLLQLLRDPRKWHPKSQGPQNQDLGILGFGVPVEFQFPATWDSGDLAFQGILGDLGLQGFGLLGDLVLPGTGTLGDLGFQGFGVRTWGARTTLMPRPPPPWAALRITGNPTRVANS